MSLFGNNDEILEKLRSIIKEELVPINARFDKVDARLDKVDARLDKVDARLNAMGQEIGRLGNQMGYIAEGYAREELLKKKSSGV